MTDTSTLIIPFNPNRDELGFDSIIAVVPQELVTPPPEPPGVPALMLAQLSLDQATMMGEYIRLAEWWVTRDPEVVREHGQGDRCPVCQEGVHTALAQMALHPELVLAVGRLSWCQG